MRMPQRKNFVVTGILVFDFELHRWPYNDRKDDLGKGIPSQRRQEYMIDDERVIIFVGFFIGTA